MIESIPDQAVTAALMALMATMGAHLVAEKAMPDNKRPAIVVAMYIGGAALCAALTYTTWCESAVKGAADASLAASVAWGMAHPVASSAAIWAARKYAPGLLADVKKKNR